ncbi:hypothetical protein [Thalassomonas actiniarum]|uniref:Uncharacterized protein n=1 Tax=Thalassomonas actiniarum TaxID=485447 RepID=A0AAE9YV57_9GAMM|nr:hypothetical protein [Thalassomonas actiniarum]WDE00939.1 hypothetical protein SG35_010085 [Thalassomonas actiniarum]
MNINGLNLYAPATRLDTGNPYQKLSDANQPDNHQGQNDSVTISPAAIAAAGGQTHQQDPVDRYQALASNQAVERSRQAMAPAKVSREDFMEKAIQGTLDQRTGVDREKLEELEEQMQKVAANKNLTDEQKAEQLAALQQQIDEITEEAAKQTTRQEHSARITKEQEQIINKA